MGEQMASFSKDQNYASFKEPNGSGPNEKCSIREKK